MLGARIVTLRRGCGKSQAQLARALGITAAALGAYELGRRTPDAVMLVKLSQTLGVSVDYLLTGRPVSQADRRAFVRDRLGKFEPKSQEGAMVFCLLMELTQT